MMVKEKKSDAIKKRAIEHGILFIKRDATVRSVAKLTGYSKTTVHLDLYRLEEIHPYLFQKVKEKLKLNTAVRHIRGGEATKKIAERKKKNDIV
jgi:putative DeoR family transcriptional regulator (stage III sporulation protein D)